MKTLLIILATFSFFISHSQTENTTDYEIVDWNNTTHLM